MKIVYCTDSICYVGGISRITIAKASALAAIPGNEVWIAVTDNRKQLTLPIHPKVHVVDLQINYFEDDWKGKLYVLKGIFYKRRLHKQKLTTLLEQILPDIVIATGTSEKYFLPSIHVSSHPAVIREIHFFKYYRQAAANNRFAKLMAAAGDLLDYRVYIHRYDKIVVLTEEDKQTNWDNDTKICVIPNPVTEVSELRSTHNSKKVIAAGRLSYQKNFASLIRIWSMVHVYYPDWMLEIWGSGGYQAQLEAQIQELNLQDSAFLMGHSSAVLSKMADASIYALSSVFEGLPLVIVEAMSVGLPVVAYECPTGPKDIISEGQDGFLVPAGDEQLFAKRLQELMADSGLRAKMGANALKKAEQYRIEPIIQLWMDLFAQLKSQKNEK